MLTVRSANPDQAIPSTSGLAAVLLVIPGRVGAQAWYSGLDRSRERTRRRHRGCGSCGQPHPRRSARRVRCARAVDERVDNSASPVDGAAAVPQRSSARMARLVTGPGGVVHRLSTGLWTTVVTEISRSARWSCGGRPRTVHRVVHRCGPWDGAGLPDSRAVRARLSTDGRTCRQVNRPTQLCTSLWRTCATEDGSAGLLLDPVGQLGDLVVDRAALGHQLADLAGRRA